MELSSGTRLGRHELLGPLGKGGMGEVYRARESFVTARTERRFRPTSAVVVLNWFEELNRLFLSSP